MSQLCVLSIIKMKYEIEARRCVDNTNYETTNYERKGAQEESQQNGVHQEVVRPPCSAGYKCGLSECEAKKVRAKAQKKL